MALDLPRIFNYGEYRSNSRTGTNNYGTHCMAVQIPGIITVYFSYQTPIAFDFKGHTVIRENAWGPTTGKHLNFVDRDKSKRIAGSDFEKLYQIAMNKPQMEHEEFTQAIRDVVHETQVVKEALAA